jgi:molecular chaperone GrpE
LEDKEKTEEIKQETAEVQTKPEQQEAEPETEKAAEKNDKVEEAKEEMQKKLEEAQQSIDKQKDQLLRIAAEYDNYRKRTDREKTSIYADATAAAVAEFLPVADNLERALAQEDCSVEDLRKGIEMVQTQFIKALENLKVQQMGEPGEPFNPDLHNAVSHIDDENAGENTVAQVYQKGYKIGDKIVRHATVVVAN